MKQYEHLFEQLAEELGADCSPVVLLDDEYYQTLFTSFLAHISLAEEKNKDVQIPVSISGDKVLCDDYYCRVFMHITPSKDNHKEFIKSLILPFDWEPQEEKKLNDRLRRIGKEGRSFKEPQAIYFICYSAFYHDRSLKNHLAHFYKHCRANGTILNSDKECSDIVQRLIDEEIPKNNPTRDKVDSELRGNVETAEFSTLVDFNGVINRINISKSFLITVSILLLIALSYYGWANYRSEKLANEINLLIKNSNYPNWLRTEVNDLESKGTFSSETIKHVLVVIRTANMKKEQAQNFLSEFTKNYTELKKVGASNYVHRDAKKSRIKAQQLIEEGNVNEARAIMLRSISELENKADATFEDLSMQYVDLARIDLLKDDFLSAGRNYLIAAEMLERVQSNDKSKKKDIFGKKFLYWSHAYAYFSIDGKNHSNVDALNQAITIQSDLIRELVTNLEEFDVTQKQAEGMTIGIRMHLVINLEILSWLVDKEENLIRAQDNYYDLITSCDKFEELNENDLCYLALAGMTTVLLQFTKKTDDDQGKLLAVRRLEDAVEYSLLSQQYAPKTSLSADDNVLAAKARTLLAKHDLFEFTNSQDELIAVLKDTQLLLDKHRQEFLSGKFAIAFAKLCDIVKEHPDRFDIEIQTAANKILESKISTKRTDIYDANQIRDVLHFKINLSERTGDSKYLYQALPLVTKAIEHYIDDEFKLADYQGMMASLLVSIGQEEKDASIIKNAISLYKAASDNYQKRNKLNDKIVALRFMGASIQILDKIEMRECNEMTYTALLDELTLLSASVRSYRKIIVENKESDRKEDARFKMDSSFALCFKDISDKPFAIYKQLSDI